MPGNANTPSPIVWDAPIDTKIKNKNSTKGNCEENDETYYTENQRT